MGKSSVKNQSGANYSKQSVKKIDLDAIKREFENEIAEEKDEELGFTLEDLAKEWKVGKKEASAIIKKAIEAGKMERRKVVIKDLIERNMRVMRFFCV